MKIYKHVIYFFIFLFFLQITSPESSVRYLEIKPQKSEGIYQLLRRAGLKANRTGYDAFRNINLEIMTNGDALFPDMTYKLPVVIVSFDETYDTILQKFGVKKFREEIFTFNVGYNPEFKAKSIVTVVKGQVLYIPELTSGFYETDNIETSPVAESVPVVDEGRTSIPYPDLKDTFKKGSVSNKLNKYCFVLDPGHGGNDPGTNPFVERGDGKEAHAYEAPLVYDTTLRLMKCIIENDGDVFLTHYSPDFGIRNVKNPQHYRNQKYNMSGKNINTDKPIASIRERKSITGNIIKKKYNKGKKVVFLSIHADYLPNKKTDLPITFFYHKTTVIDGGKSKKFAQDMARAVTGSEKNSKAQYLGVLFNNPAHLEILIELANLNNKNGAWRLRDHSYREKLAGMICDGLIKSLP
ncbi:MAG: N-acetylmuramoyl-L-alanine amidase [Candidatus Latescibacteria bacterium]|nr:N-acetylmuramoyl-L-alanine amidase [Candidatus Latescibacterota bacterium]